MTWDFPVLEENIRCFRDFARFHRRDAIRMKQTESTTISSYFGGKFIGYLRGFAVGEIRCVPPGAPAPTQSSAMRLYGYLVTDLRY